MTDDDLGVVWVMFGDGQAVNSPGGPSGITGFGYLAFADFNHDGKLDLVAAYESTDCLSILLGNGDGSFQAPQNHVTGNTPIFVGVVTSLKTR